MFDNNVCWRSPQPPRQAPITSYNTSCCRQGWVCFTNVTQILNKTSNNSTPQRAAFHNLLPPCMVHVQLAAGGVRTRSRTSASWHQTQVELGYTGCRSSAPGSVLSALASEYTRSLTKNPFGAHFLHQRLLLYQQPFAQPCTGLMWGRRSLFSSGNVCNTRKPHGESIFSSEETWNSRNSPALECKKTGAKVHQPWVCVVCTLQYTFSLLYSFWLDTKIIVGWHVPIWTGFATSWKMGRFQTLENAGMKNFNGQ